MRRHPRRRPQRRHVELGIVLELRQHCPRIVGRDVQDRVHQGRPHRFQPGPVPERRHDAVPGQFTLVEAGIIAAPHMENDQRPPLRPQLRHRRIEWFAPVGSQAEQAAQEVLVARPAFRQLLEIAPEIDAHRRIVHPPQREIVVVEAVEAQLRMRLGAGARVGQPEQPLPVPGRYRDPRPGAQPVQAQEGVLEQLVGETTVAAQRGHADRGRAVHPGERGIGQQTGADIDAQPPVIPAQGPAQGDEAAVEQRRAERRAGRLPGDQDGNQGIERPSVLIGGQEGAHRSVTAEQPVDGRFLPVGGGQPLHPGDRRPVRRPGLRFLRKPVARPHSRKALHPDARAPDPVKRFEDH